MIVANPSQSNTRWLQVCVLLCALVVLPLGLSCQRGYTVTDAEKLTGEDGVHDEEIQTPTGPMVLIPAGEFTMGTTSEQEQWLRDEGWWHDWQTSNPPPPSIWTPTT